MRLFFLVLLYLIPTLSIGQSMVQERRSLWIVRDALTDKKKINQLIHTADRLNITDLFIQVRALGQSYYNSSVEPKTKKLEIDFDPLTYLIEKSARYSFEIHAWVNMFYIWAGERIPENKNHLFNKLAEYVLRKDVFPDYKNLRNQGFEGFFLDPKVPEVQVNLIQILEEIAHKYQLKGIHLDYFRYPGLNYSFTPTSRTLFMLEEMYDPWMIYHSQKIEYDSNTYKIFMHADRRYRRLLNDTLSKYLEQIKITLRAINPKLELSVAVKPDPITAKHRYFQDWINWLDKKLCDFVVIMNYRTDMREFNSILEQVIRKTSQERIIVGVSTYNQDVTAVLHRLERIRADAFAGYSLFSYNHLAGNRDYLNQLQRQILVWR